jgi:hypothetical protein
MPLGVHATSVDRLLCSLLCIKMLSQSVLNTLGPLNIRAVEIFLGYARASLMDMLTPKISCKCLNIYQSYGNTFTTYSAAA